MKKLVLAVTIICTMALTACGSDASTTEYGTDNNATESTVESTVEDTTEYVEDVVEDTTEETVVEDATEVVEEVVEESNNNTQPVDWTGYGEGQVSIMYIDGTVYEGIADPDDPEGYVYAVIDDKQYYGCDTITLGLKSYGDLYTFNTELKIDDVDRSLNDNNGGPNWFYHTGAWNESGVHAGVEFSDDIMSLYFIKDIADDDAYIINGTEFRTVQDFVDVFGKPYGIYYNYGGADDATVGDAPRYYIYDYKLNDSCNFNIEFEMSNSNPGECEIKVIQFVSTDHMGFLEDLYYVNK